MTLTDPNCCAVNVKSGEQIVGCIS